MDSAETLDDVVAAARRCTICADQLALGPRPILQVGADARITVIGQAPGRGVHESGIPWADPSGDQLRIWLGVDATTFYDPTQIALLPMGFCYPGTGSSGDLPPRPECAPTWHPRILDRLPADRLTILIGRYAQARYLQRTSATLTETVRSWRDHLPTVVLPHPSPRNQRWFRSNPWFENELIPEIQTLVEARLKQ